MWSLPAIWRPQIAPRRRLPRDSKRCRARVVTMILKVTQLVLRSSRGRPADDEIIRCLHAQTRLSIGVAGETKSALPPEAGAVSRQGGLASHRNRCHNQPPPASQLFASRNTCRETARTSLKQKATWA
ncbi:uncharacterized protein K441DRAFT_363871 [Cenococcum geophilum 1.58]|uniref:uncharacterized protein n=1 Tax=Cenococcum geophilum 1.58 TaxID=794803 RepID=UPI00358E4FB4|nr:hypothetical protein K441DRAFT_363871 [Cenococcum geophilum 1.58]